MSSGDQSLRANASLLSHAYSLALDRGIIGNFAPICLNGGSHVVCRRGGASGSVHVVSTIAVAVPKQKQDFNYEL